MSLRLPRLINSLPITKPEGGTPALSFMQWWDTFAKQIETFASDITNALTQAGIAITTANSANNVAKLAGSGTENLTLSATDAGSDASIMISAHNRLYADGTTVSLDAGTLTGLAYSTKYYIHYDDSSFAGGAVTYQASTTDTAASQTGSTHFVGIITSPAAADPDTGGVTPGPPGPGDIERLEP